MSMSQPPHLPPLQQQQHQQHHHHHQHNHNHHPPQSHPQHYDGAHLQHLPAHYAAAAAAGPSMTAPAMHPPPSYHHPFAYPHNGAMQQPPPMPSNMLVNGNGTMRYALPPQMAPGNLAPRSASAKQIKRRTKTGCLTCRKRRIKVSRDQHKTTYHHYTAIVAIHPPTLRPSGLRQH